MKFTAFIALFFAASGVFALPLENLVTAAQAARLNSSKETIIEAQLSNPTPRMLPQFSELRQHVTRLTAAVKPSVIIETMSLYPKPDRYHTSNLMWDISQKTGVFNQLTAISSLEGIQYYSSSRGAMRVFYEYSKVIEGPTSRNIRPDPVYTQIPPELTLYARQRDGTFGDNVYRYDYKTYPDAVLFAQENVTGLSYGFIPVIGKGKLRSIMAFFDCGDSILIYTISMADAVSLPGISDRIKNSFSSRAEAVLNWFIARLNRNLFI